MLWLAQVRAMVSSLPEHFPKIFESFAAVEAGLEGRPLKR